MGGEEEVVIWIEEEEKEEDELGLLLLIRSSGLQHCRICHEAELESSKNLEAPCACSGTVKFAHRDCIQRWCDEKGNITCEICLQKYEPGYTATSKKVKLLDSMAIREESTEIASEENETQEEEVVVVVRGGDSECTDAADRNASFCRSLALILTFILLLRDLFATCSGGRGDYPFPLLTVIVFRASGIVLPMYIVIQTVSAIRKNIHEYNQNSSRVDEESAAGEEQLHLV